MTTDIVKLVRIWFEAVGQASGPLLPDGWFGGRPYDNLYFLEDVSLLNNVLQVKLSEETMLSFDGPGRVFVENSDLLFDGFRQMSIRWKHYGGDEDAPHYEHTYDQGQVRLAAPIGMKVDLR
jgi:hypothetical protein